jgi:peptidoglycan/LPS O-acetylase OafA/YrhL
MLSAKNHIHEIDGLRGIAILCVVIYHLVALPLIPHFENQTNKFLTLFAYGVDLFFVISGFLIGRILLKVEGFSGVRTFYIRRILRIWPLYYLLLITVYLAVPDKQLFSQLPNWTFLLFIFNFWESYGKGVHQALGPLWSIAIEEQFYLFAPFAFLVFNRKKISILLVIYLLVAPLLRWLLFYNTDIDLWRFTPVRMDGICIGLLLSIFLSSRENILFVAKRIKFLGFLTFFLLVSLIPSILIFPDIIWVSFGFSLLSMAFGSVLLIVQVQCFLNQGNRLLNSVALRYLGLHCYSIYLFHMFFALIIGGIIDDFYAGLIIESILILLFAQLTWRYIEAPLIRLGQKFSYFAGEGSSTELIQPESVQLGVENARTRNP